MTFADEGITLILHHLLDPRIDFTWNLVSNICIKPQLVGVVRIVNARTLDRFLETRELSQFPRMITPCGN